MEKMASLTLSPSSKDQAQRSNGYKRLTSLWSAIITSKVTEALLATAQSANHSPKETLLDLNTEQVLLLCLVHSLVKKDAAACFALSEITMKVESLTSPYLRIWLKEEYSFSCNDIRTALGFAADLAKNGLPFPEIILSILENLYYLYCSPRRKNSSSSLDEMVHHILPSPNETSSKPPVYRSRSMSESENSKPNLQHKGYSVKFARENKEKEDSFNKSEENLNTYYATSYTRQAIKKPESPRPKSDSDFDIPQPAPRVSLLEQESKSEVSLTKPEVKFYSFRPRKIQTPSSYSDRLNQGREKSISKTNSASYSSREPPSPILSSIQEFTTDVDAIKQKTGDTALHMAVTKEDYPNVIALIKGGASIDVRNKIDVTPMQTAVEMDNLRIIKALHAAGSNINQKNIKRESLLHIAAASAGLDTVELLIELGVDLDAKDNRNQTPLFRATKKGNIVVMEKLEENGADIFVKDTFGRSLLHYAAWHGQTEATDWLLQRGLDMNEKTRHGWTPLHWAVANRQIQTVHLLLLRGADVNVQDSANRTPLYWAREAGNLALIDLLSSYHGRC